MKTVVNLEPWPIIKLNSSIFSVGSCFAKDFALSMKKKGISLLVNPFGTIYNSYSIYKLLDIIINDYAYTEKNILHYKDTFFSLEHSTIFDSANQNRIIEDINNNIEMSLKYLEIADIFIITLGTAIVYKHKGTNKIVANCHKLPNEFFKEYTLSIDENTEYLKNIVGLINKLNKEAKIIFTISPVRHNLKNLQANSHSKAILRVSIDQIISHYKNTFYFPSYEIVIDELRDYKFYKKDKLHLKKASFNYVLKRFIYCYFSDKLQIYMEKYEKYRLFKKHNVKNKSDIRYFFLVMKNLELLNDLSSERPSQILLREICLLIVSLISLFYKDKSDDIRKRITIVLKGYEDILNFFVASLAISSKEKITIDFDLEFAPLIKKYPFLEEFYTKMLLEFYHHEKNYKKISEIYRSSL